eukprot:TRINITY_DN37103_c0_g1_i1.p1 TRINITY_DN37103_c0_g1~~TRINITY_DN37103_c0_g1_i1.p1  ORF type:complete len:134 (-),score=17.67 TRINITY_DN37103_c0_g1_i1:629-1030(-)
MTNLELSLAQIIPVLLLSCLVCCVDPESGGVVQRLMSQRDDLIQPGLSYMNTSGLSTVNTLSLGRLQNLTHSYQIGCVINIENWSKWLLGYPVYYLQYGGFLYKIPCSEKVFPLSHREVVITVNNGGQKFYYG